MTDGQDGLPPPRRPARGYAPPSAVPYTPPARRAEPSAPVPPGPRVVPRRSLLSVVLVLAVLVVLSLLLGSLGDVTWPWEGAIGEAAP